MEISSSPSPKNIPNDVIFEIFSWAPAHSLMRFRWACKYWFNLIRDSKFAKMHLLHHSISTTNDNSEQFINNTSFLITHIRCRCRPSPAMYSMSFRDVFNESFSVKEIKIDYYNLFPISESCTTHEDLIFRDCCNGLIYFIRTSRKIYVHIIWNPTTGEFKELPEDQSNINSYNAKIIIDGFGYDHTNDDYKVVRVAYYNQAGSSTLSREINVYTLASNSWSKKVEITDYCVSIVLGSCLGLFVNGALHWIMSNMRSSSRRNLVNIISFDIAKEEHGEIQLPDNLANICWSTLKSDLKVLNECLCIFHINGESYCKKMDIWMMKDYGMKDSWTKLFTINMNQLSNDISQPSMMKLYPALKLLKYHKEGEFLIVLNGKYIIVYDLMRETRRKIIRYDVHKKIEDDDGFEDVCVKAIYIETLVSLNSGKYLTVAGSRRTTLRKHMRNEEHHWKKLRSVTSTQHEHNRDEEDQRNKIKKQKI